MFINLENGIKLHYEIIGAGEPLLLLHGNGDSLEGLKKLGQALASHYKVYLIDSRGHGMSSNHNEVVDYPDFAEDIDLFIKQLNLDKVNIIGHSDGAIISALMAMEGKAYLNKIVLLGISLNFEQMRDVWKNWVYNEYEKTNHHPLIKLILEKPNIKMSDLSKIKIPTYVVAGERDIIDTHLYFEMAETIENSDILILKGENHSSYIIDNDMFAKYALSFLKK